jgi:hypothetical protein
MPAASTTPLLLLLDSVLCQDREQLETAMNQVRKLLRIDVPPLANLSDVVGILIKTRPDLALVSSEHDNSLPLHFAASIGDVSVADILIAAVRCRAVLFNLFACSFRNIGSDIVRLSPYSEPSSHLRAQ